MSSFIWRVYSAPLVHHYLMFFARPGLGYGTLKLYNSRYYLSILAVKRQDEHKDKRNVPYTCFNHKGRHLCMVNIHKCYLCKSARPWYNGLIQVKEEGWSGFSEGWQGCSEGFPEGEARGKSWGAALPAPGKPRPSRLFYLDLHPI